jgi:hypothetical protein
MLLSVIQTNLLSPCLDYQRRRRMYGQMNVPGIHGYMEDVSIAPNMTSLELSVDGYSRKLQSHELFIVVRT